MPMPVTPLLVQVPARLSAKMLLNSSGFENFSAPRPYNWISRNCIRALLAPVDKPAGAGRPLLVIAVAVVTLRTMVLLTMRTFGASSIAMPPPSCVETLLAMMLSLTSNRAFSGPPAMRKRMPPPSSFERLAWITLWSMVTEPAPWLRNTLFGGSSPPIMIAPPSS